MNKAKELEDIITFIIAKIHANPSKSQETLDYANSIVALTKVWSVFYALEQTKMMNKVYKKGPVPDGTNKN